MLGKPLITLGTPDPGEEARLLGEQGLAQTGALPPPGQPMVP